MAEPNTLEYVRTGAAVVAAIGVLIALRQFFLAIRQLKIATTQLEISSSNLRLQQQARLDTHERARREAAIRIIRDFSLSVDLTWSAVRKLVEKLDPDSLRELEKCRPFSVKSDLFDLVETALPFDEMNRNPPKDGSSEWKLSRRQVSIINWIAFSYLNAFELVCLAWDRDVADETIIKDQMKSFYAPNESRTLMQPLRDITGGKEVYPCIYAFVEDLSKSEAKTKTPRVGDKPVR